VYTGVGMFGLRMLVQLAWHCVSLPQLSAHGVEL
jgi:hypothetical protein